MTWALSTEEVREMYVLAADTNNSDRDNGEDFDAWLASMLGDPAKDERLARYMAMATPLGCQSALTVVQQMTALIDAENSARSIGGAS